MIEDRSLEEQAERRSDEDSLVAPTTHVRLSYPDLLEIRDGGVVYVDSVAFVKRRLYGDMSSTVFHEADFTVQLGDHHIEELSDAVGVLNWGIRYIDGERQFLFVSGGGIADDLGVDKTPEEVRREVDRRWEKLME